MDTLFWSNVLFDNREYFWLLSLEIGYVPSAICPKLIDAFIGTPCDKFHHDTRQVLSTLTLAAACSTASVVDLLLHSDGSFCPPKFCSRYQISAAMAFLSWFLSMASSLFNLWLLPSLWFFTHCSKENFCDWCKVVNDIYIKNPSSVRLHAQSCEKGGSKTTWLQICWFIWGTVHNKV